MFMLLRINALTLPRGEDVCNYYNKGQGRNGGDFIDGKDREE